jgi:hypothetical protein
MPVSWGGRRIGLWVEVVRELRLELDEWAEGEAVGRGPGDGGSWGVYTFRYMVYKPERAVGLLGKLVLVD